VDVLRTLPTLPPVDPVWGDGSAWQREADLLQALPIWRLSQVREAVRRLRAEGLVVLDDGAANLLRLTDAGHVVARSVAPAEGGSDGR
jgi:DNA-binding FadR family transcriptional regulator